MKQFKPIKSGDLGTLLKEVRSAGYFEQNYAVLDNLSGTVPLLKTKQGQYLALEVKSIDGATRYLSRALDSSNKWTLYELYG